MKIIDWIKTVYYRFSYWINCNFGLDLSTSRSPKIKDNPVEIEVLKNLRKLYRFPRNTNIAVTGGKSVGKKSYIKKFEKERFLFVGEFIHIDLREFAVAHSNTTGYNLLKTKIHDYIIKSIFSRANQRTIPTARTSMKFWRTVLGIVMSMAILGLNIKNQINIDGCLPQTCNPNAGNLCINIACIFIIFVLALKAIKHIISSSFDKRLQTKVNLNTSRLNLSVDCSKNDETENENKIISALNTMRREIGYTVVFENMDTLGEENFCNIIIYLCELNRRINNYIASRRLYSVFLIKRPIRFIYVFRNDLVQLEPGNSLPIEIILVQPTLTACNVFSALETAFNAEILKGAVFPIDKLFPIDPNYEDKVSTYIVDGRIFYNVVKRSIQWYNIFLKNIQHKSTTQNDIHGLFSLVLYSLFFPKDYSKLANKTSAIFLGNGNREDIDPEYLDLFDYLISEECPEEYRITSSSMRFVGSQPKLKEKYIK